MVKTLVCRYLILGTLVTVVDRLSIDSDVEISYDELAHMLLDPNIGLGGAIVTFLDKCILPNIENNLTNIEEGAPDYHDERKTKDCYETRTFCASGEEISFNASGLCAVSDVLSRLVNKKEFWLLGGINNGRKDLFYLYRDLNRPVYHLAVSKPQLLPDEFISPLYKSVAFQIPNSVIQEMHTIVTINEEALPITIHSVFVGEPFVVCFVGTKPSLEDGNQRLEAFFDNEHDQALVQIAADFNGLKLETFPGLDDMPIAQPTIFDIDNGINVVFAKLNNDDTINTRFFRRGTGGEEVFSGTGAVATMAVVDCLAVLSKHQARFIGSADKTGGIDWATVQSIGDKWWLKMPVKHLWSGVIELNNTGE